LTRSAGFEAFFPGAKKAGESIVKEQAKRGGNGGGKKPSGEEPPQTSLATLGALGIGAFLLMNMFNDSQGGGREINFQEFKYQLLEQGLVSSLSPSPFCERACADGGGCRAVLVVPSQG